MLYAYLLFQLAITSLSIASEGPLERALRMAWAESPLLEGQRIETDLSRGDRWRRFVPNDPQFVYGNSDDDTARSYGLALVVPFPGKALAYTKADASKARAQDSEFAARRYELSRTLTQAYLDCSSAREMLDLQRSTSDDLDLIFRSLKALYEGGRSSQSEKIGAELQARQSRLDLETATDKRDSSCAKYAALLERETRGHGQDLPAGLTVPEDLDPQLVSELGALTADEARSIAAADTATTANSLRWWSQVPDFTLSAQRNRYVYLPGSPSGKAWTTTYSLAVNLPLFLPAHQAAEAKRTAGQSLIDADTAEQQRISAHADREDAAREFRRNRARLQELRSRDLPLAEAWFDGTYSGYRSGKSSFADLVLARKTLTDLKNQDIQLRISLVGARLRCLDSCLAGAP